MHTHRTHINNPTTADIVSSIFTPHLLQTRWSTVRVAMMAKGEGGRDSITEIETTRNLRLVIFCSDVPFRHGSFRTICRSVLLCIVLVILCGSLIRHHDFARFDRPQTQISWFCVRFQANQIYSRLWTASRWDRNTHGNENNHNSMSLLSLHGIWDYNTENVQRRI